MKSGAYKTIYLGKRGDERDLLEIEELLEKLGTNWSRVVSTLLPSLKTSLSVIHSDGLHESRLQVVVGMPGVNAKNGEESHNGQGQ